MNKCINIYNPALNVSVVSLYIRSGARYVESRLEGLPHLAEHLFLSSKNSRKSDRLFDLESRGFLYNARTGKEYVNFYIICRPGLEHQALDTLMDYSRSIAIDQDALDSEKSTISIEISLASALDKLLESSERVLWKGSSLENRVLGTKLSVRAITLDEINRYIDLNISEEKIVPVVISRKRIGRNGAISKKAIIKPIVALVPHKRVSTSFKNGYVILSIALPPMNGSGQQALDYIAHALAGGWSSILLTKLRHDSNLIYWINYKIRFHSDATTFHIIIKTNEANQQVVSQSAIEMLSKTSLYSRELLDLMRNISGSYEMRQALKGINPYENLIKATELLTAQDDIGAYSFTKIPSSRSIDHVLKMLRDVAQIIKLS